MRVVVLCSFVEGQGKLHWQRVEYDLVSGVRDCLTPRGEKLLLKVIGGERSAIQLVAVPNSNAPTDQAVREYDTLLVLQKSLSTVYVTSNLACSSQPITDWCLFSSLKKEGKGLAFILVPKSL